MDAQPLPLTPEMSQAIAANGGLPLRFEDPETHEFYLLVEEPVEVTLDEEYIRQGIQEALDSVERGDVVPWDVEAFLAEAHRQFESRE